MYSCSKEHAYSMQLKCQDRHAVLVVTWSPPAFSLAEHSDPLPDCVYLQISTNYVIIHTASFSLDRWPIQVMSCSFALKRMLSFALDQKDSLVDNLSGERVEGALCSCSDDY